MQFPLHTPESAPEASKPLIENSIKAFGVLPALHAIMAESPQLLEGYQKLHELFLASSLTPEEKTVVWMTVNVEHECHYCVPAHTIIAKKMGIAPEIIDALRDQTPLPNERLEALRAITRELLLNRGNVSPETLARFEAAGYGPRQLLDVILGVAQKVMSNFTNHLANTPLSPAYQPYAWKRRGKAATTNAATAAES